MAESRIDIQIRDLLTLCLTQAIDRAVSPQYGRRWFSDFAAREADYEPGKRIVQNGQTHISQCDLQACLKILRFREEYCFTVLSYYGFFIPRDPQSNEARRKQLTALLDRLIKDYRNAMDAHARACDIQRDLDSAHQTSLYNRQDAVADMIKLAQILRPVCDEKGVSYFDRMSALRDQWMADQKRMTYSISAIMTREQLGRDKAAFLQCCESLGIPISTVDGELCFSTTNYRADVERLRDRMALMAHRNAPRPAPRPEPRPEPQPEPKPQPKKRAVWPWIVLCAALLVALGVVLAVLLWPAPEEEAKSATESTTKPTGNVLYAPANYRNSDYDVVINPRYVRWEGSELVAECYIINNLDVAITDISVESIYIEGENGPICAGSFGELAGLTVDGCSYARWEFRFPANTVTDPGAVLDPLRVKSSLTYK